MARLESFPGCTGCCPSGIETDCCAEATPEDLTATITNVSACACLAGTVPLAWDGAIGWAGTAALCSETVSVALRCVGGTWSVAVACVTGGGNASGLTADACDPFQLTASGVAIAGSCCTGTVDIVVTE